MSNPFERYLQATERQNANYAYLAEGAPQMRATRVSTVPTDFVPSEKSAGDLLVDAAASALKIPTIIGGVAVGAADLALSAASKPFEWAMDAGHAVRPDLIPEPMDVGYGYIAKGLHDTIGYRPEEAKAFIDEKLFSDARKIQEKEYQSGYTAAEDKAFQDSWVSSYQTQVANLQKSGATEQQLKDFNTSFDKQYQEAATQRADKYQTSWDKPLSENIDIIGHGFDNLLENPSLALGGAIESGGYLLPSMLVSRGVMALEKAANVARVGKVAAAEMAGKSIGELAITRSPFLAAGIGEGSVSGLTVLEQMRSQIPDGIAGGKELLGALGVAASTGLIGAGFGKAASKLGIDDVDSVGLGRAASQVAAMKLPALTRPVGAIAQEGAEEFLQTFGESIIPNVTMGKDPLEGLGQELPLGTLAGAIMGAGMNAPSLVGGGFSDISSGLGKVKEAASLKSFDTLSNPEHKNYNPAQAFNIQLKNLESNDETVRTQAEASVSKIETDLNTARASVEKRINSIQTTLKAMPPAAQTTDAQKLEIEALSKEYTDLKTKSDKLTEHLIGFIDAQVTAQEHRDVKQGTQFTEEQAKADIATLTQPQTSTVMTVGDTQIPVQVEGDPKVLADGTEKVIVNYTDADGNPVKKVVPTSSLASVESTDTTAQQEALNRVTRHFSKYSSDDLDALSNSPVLSEAQRNSLRVMSESKRQLAAVQDPSQVFDNILNGYKGKTIQESHRGLNQYTDMVNTAVATKNPQLASLALDGLGAFTDDHTAKRDTINEAFGLVQKGTYAEVQAVRTQDGTWGMIPFTAQEVKAGKNAAGAEYLNKEALNKVGGLNIHVNSDKPTGGRAVGTITQINNETQLIQDRFDALSGVAESFVGVTPKPVDTSTAPTIDTPVVTESSQRSPKLEETYKETFSKPIENWDANDFASVGVQATHLGSTFDSKTIEADNAFSQKMAKKIIADGIAKNRSTADIMQDVMFVAYSSDFAMSQSGVDALRAYIELRKAQGTSTTPIVTEPLNDTDTEVKNKILSEYPIERLVYGGRSKTAQDAIKAQDLKAMKKAYNLLKAEEQIKLLEANNKKIETELAVKRELFRKTKATKVGDIVTIVNDDDENGGEYKAKILELTKYKTHALLKIKVKSGKEYNISVDQYGDTRTGSITGFVFEAEAPETRPQLLEEINNLKAQIQEVKDTSDYYVDYFKEGTTAPIVTEPSDTTAPVVTPAPEAPVQSVTVRKARAALNRLKTVYRSDISENLSVDAVTTTQISQWKDLTTAKGKTKPQRQTDAIRADIAIVEQYVQTKPKDTKVTVGFTPTPIAERAKGHKAAVVVPDGKGGGKYIYEGTNADVTYHYLWDTFNDNLVVLRIASNGKTGASVSTVDPLTGKIEGTLTVASTHITPEQVIAGMKGMVVVGDYVQATSTLSEKQRASSTKKYITEALNGQISLTKDKAEATRLRELRNTLTGVKPRVRSAKSKTVFPDRHSLLDAIKILGGVSRTEAKKLFGLIDTSDIAIGVLTNGERTLSFEQMAEALAQDGYPVTEKGSSTGEALFESLQKALNGEDIGTDNYMIAKAEAQRNADLQAEQDTEIEAIKAPVEPTVKDEPTTPTETKTPVNVWAGSDENTGLSNLATRPFTFGTKKYQSVEHAYQTLKSGSFDQQTYDKYAGTENKKIAGNRGTKTTDNANVRLMEKLMTASFEQNKDAMELLQKTGNTVITHTQDKSIWGKEFPRILMEIRESNKTPEPSQDTTTATSIDSVSIDKLEATVKSFVKVRDITSEEYKQDTATVYEKQWFKVKAAYNNTVRRLVELVSKGVTTVEDVAALTDILNKLYEFAGQTIDINSDRAALDKLTQRIDSLATALFSDVSPEIIDAYLKGKTESLERRGDKLTTDRDGAKSFDGRTIEYVFNAPHLQETKTTAPVEAKPIIPETTEDTGKDNKADLILPIGTSGSGKSTWIKSVNSEGDYTVISLDDLRVELTGDVDNKTSDEAVYAEAIKRAVDAVKVGKQVIFDTTNLKKDRRAAIIDAIRKAKPNANIQYKLLPLDPALAKQRIKDALASGEARANVDDATIDRHAKAYVQALEDIKQEGITAFPEIVDSNKIGLALQGYTNHSGGAYGADTTEVGFKLTPTGQYTSKDQLKADKATKFIGEGAANSSTAQYAKDAGDKANTGKYTKNDVVFISVNGARANRQAPNLVEIQKAIDAGATILTDKLSDRERSFNVGEREVAAHLTKNGYVEEGNTGVWKPKAKTAEATSPVSNEAGSSITVREGVQELYDSTPELAEIGTVEEYSQYLDSVFPDSKVKDVVYHGTDVSKDDVTFKSGRGGIFLASTSAYASYFSENDNAYPVLVNFQNTYKAKGLTDDIGEAEVEQIKSKGYDSVLGKGGISKMQKHQNDLEFIAFEPEQIHVLGSKKDVDGFKKFITPEVEETSSESQVEPVATEDAKVTVLQDVTDEVAAEERKKPFNLRNILKGYFTQSTTKEDATGANPLVTVKDFLSNFDVRTQVGKWLNDRRKPTLKQLEQVEHFKKFHAEFARALKFVFNTKASAIFVSNKENLVGYLEMGKKPSTRELDENVVTALALSAYSYLIKQGNKVMNTNEELETLFRLKKGVRAPFEIEQMFRFAGQEMPIVVKALGTDAAKALGLKVREDQDPTLQDRLNTALGILAMEAMANAGFIVIETLQDHPTDEKNKPLTDFLTTIKAVRESKAHTIEDEYDFEVDTDAETQISKFTMVRPNAKMEGEGNSVFEKGIVETVVDGKIVRTETITLNRPVLTGGLPTLNSPLVNELIEANKDTKGFLSYLFGVDVGLTTPLKEIPKKFTQRLINGTDASVPSVQAELLTEAQKHSFTMRTNTVAVFAAMQKLGENSQFLKELLGIWIDDHVLSRTHVTERDSLQAKAQNDWTAVLNGLEWADATLDENGQYQEFYDTQFVAQNQRQHINSNMFSAQSSQIHRAMAALTGFSTTIDLTKDEQGTVKDEALLNLFYQAVGEGLEGLDDYLKADILSKAEAGLHQFFTVDKVYGDYYVPALKAFLQTTESKSAIKAMRALIETGTIDTTQQKAIAAFVDKGKMGAQSLQSLIALAELDIAQDSKEQIFTTTIGFGSDGVNHGVSAANMLTGVISKDMRQQTGIFPIADKGQVQISNMQEVYRRKITDYYVDFGKVMSAKLRDLVDTLVGKLNTDFVQGMTALFPKFEVLDDTGELRDLLAMRKIAKIWAIPFNYSAGKAALQRALARGFLAGIYGNMNKLANEALDIIDAGRKEGVTEEEKAALRLKLGTVKLKTKTLEDNLNKVLRKYGMSVTLPEPHLLNEEDKGKLSSDLENTLMQAAIDLYGEAAWQATEEFAKDYLEVRNVYTEVEKASFTLFDVVRNQLIEEKKASRKYTNVNAKVQVKRETVQYTAEELNAQEAEYFGLTTVEMAEIDAVLAAMRPMFNTALSIGSESTNAADSVTNPSGVSVRKHKMQREPAKGLRAVNTFYLKETDAKGKPFSESRNIGLTKEVEENAGVASSANAIQSIDAFVAAKVQGFMDALNVHDNAVFGLKDFLKGVKKQNEEHLKALTNYQLGLEHAKMLVKVYVGYKAFMATQEEALKSEDVMVKENAQKLITEAKRQMQVLLWGEQMFKGDTALIINNQLVYKGGLIPKLQAANLDIKDSADIEEAISVFINFALAQDLQKLEVLLDTYSIHQFAGEGGMHKLTKADKTSIDEQKALVQKALLDLDTELNGKPAPMNTTEAVKPTTELAKFLRKAKGAVIDITSLIEHLTNNTDINDLKARAAQLEVLKAITPLIDETTKVIYSEGDYEGYGYYDEPTNTLHINSAKEAEGGVRSTLAVHELLHAALSRRIKTLNISIETKEAEAKKTGKEVSFTSAEVALRNLEKLRVNLVTPDGMRMLELQAKLGSAIEDSTQFYKDTEELYESQKAENISTIKELQALNKEEARITEIEGEIKKRGTSIGAAYKAQLEAELKTLTPKAELDTKRNALLTKQQAMRDTKALLDKANEYFELRETLSKKVLSERTRKDGSSSKFTQLNLVEMLANIHDFISYGLTESRLQEAMKSTQVDRGGRTFSVKLRKFVEFVGQILGFRSKEISALAAFASDTAALLETIGTVTPVVASNNGERLFSTQSAEDQVNTKPEINTAIEQARKAVRELLTQLNFKFVDSPDVNLSDIERIASKYLTEGKSNNDPAFLKDAAIALSYAIYFELGLPQGNAKMREGLEQSLLDWLTTGEIPKLHKSVWVKAVEIFNKIMAAFSGKEFKAIESRLEATLNKIINREDFSFKPKQGYAKLVFQKEMTNNPLAVQSLLTFIKSGIKFALTGSVAYADQVPLYRQENKPLHDMDFLVAPEDLQDAYDYFTQKDPDNWGGSFTLYDVVKEGKRILGFAIVPKGFVIKNGKSEWNREQEAPERSYDVFNVVTGLKAGSYYFLGGKEEVFTGIAGITIDLLAEDARDTVTQTFKDTTGTNKSIEVSSYVGGFTAKLDMLRLKDINDFIGVVPPTERVLSKPKAVKPIEGPITKPAPAVNTIAQYQAEAAALEDDALDVALNGLLDKQRKGDKSPLLKMKFKAYNDEMNKRGAAVSNKGERRYSKNTSSGNGLTVASVRQILVKHFGEKLIKALEAKGLLRIVETMAQTPEAALERGTDGYYLNGQATLVAAGLTAKTVVATLLHELIGHKGFQELMGPAAYNALMKQFNKLVAEGNPIALAALKRAQEATGSDGKPLSLQGQMDEYLPYLLTIQAAINATQAQKSAIAKFIDNVFRAVRAWAYKKLQANGYEGAASTFMQPQDIVFMAERMLREIGNTKGTETSTTDSQLGEVRKKYKGTDQWMKAPNGQPTKLNERQWLQVRTDNFKQWFGDWENDSKNASQVVDENGEPLVVYHGTRTKEKFTEFYTFTAGIFGAGAYFSVRKHEAGGYAKGGKIYEAFINVRKPLSLSDKAFMQNYYTPATQEEAISLGYDAAITTKGAEHKIDYVIAFDPNQIKSAVDNTGAFSPMNPDIRFSKKPPSAEDLVNQQSSLDIMTALPHSNTGAFNQQLDRLIVGEIGQLYNQDDAAKARIDEIQTFTASDALNAGFSLSRKEQYVQQALQYAVAAYMKLHAGGANVGQLRRVYHAAKAKMDATGKDFHEGDWATATQQEKDIAKAKYDFLFDSTKEGYMDRFVSMALASEAVNKLLDIALPLTKPDTQDKTWFEKVNDWVSYVMAWLTNKYVRLNPIAGASSQLVQLMDNLVKLDIRNRQEGVALHQKAWNTIGLVTTPLNKALKGAGGALLSGVGLRNSRFLPVRALGAILVLRSEEAAKAIPKMIIDMRNNQLPNTKLGEAANILLEASGVGTLRDKFDVLIRQTNLNAKNRQDIVDGVKKAVNKWFKTPLTKAQNKAIAYGLLGTDAQALLENYSVEDIVKMALHEGKLNAEIAKLKKEIAKNPNGNDMLNAAEQLGYYMVTRIGGEGLVKNALGITIGLGTQYFTPVEQADPKLVGQLNTLVSMLAMTHVPNSDKAILAALYKTDAEGIHATIQLHQGLVNDSLKDFQANPLNMVKGWMPEVTNPYLEIKAASEAERPQMLKEGWKEIGKLKRDPEDFHSRPKYLMKHNDIGYQRLVSGAVDLGSTARSGTEAISRTSPDYLGITQARYQNAARRAAIPNSSFDPSKQPRGLIAAYDTNGMPLAYNYEMDNETRDAHLDRKHNIGDLLGTFGGLNYYKPEKAKQSNTVAEVLFEDYKANYSQNPNAYLKISHESTDPKVVEMWRMLPQDFKQRATELYGKGNPIIIRNEAFNLAFGFKKFSVVSYAFDAVKAERERIKNGLVGTGKSPNAFQSGFVRFAEATRKGTAQADFAKAEHVTQEIVKAIKDFIVIRSGTTTMWNIFANVLMLMANGINPVTIIKDWVFAVTNVRAYQKLNSQLIQAQADLAGGKDPVALKQRIGALKAELKANVMNPYINAGLLSSIVDDVNIQHGEYTYTSAFKQTVDEKTQWIPKPVKTAAAVLTIAPSTKLYQFLATTTQLSDFVAKYSMSKHLQTNGTDIDASIIEASKTFINYDVPTSQGLQYANDMGLFMFTKFFLRIQAVLMKLLGKRAGSTIAQHILVESLTGAEGILSPIAYGHIGNNPLESSVLGLPSAFFGIGTIDAVTDFGVSF